MLDLFDQPQTLVMPDADVRYWPTLSLPTSPDDCLTQLLEETPWRQDEITVFGKTHLQPRLSQWYGDPESAYTYSGLTLIPLLWTPLLAALKEAVSAATEASYNSVLLNYYRDGRDSMGMHADDERELGAEPVIASLSFGDTRVLTFKHRSRKDLQPVKVPLQHGSLLVMRGSTQRDWKHGIAKRVSVCGPRINLTFRYVRG